MDTINREDNRSYGNTTRFHRSRCFTILSLEIEKVLIYMNFFFVGERGRERVRVSAKRTGRFETRGFDIVNGTRLSGEKCHGSLGAWRNRRAAVNSFVEPLEALHRAPVSRSAFICKCSLTLADLMVILYCGIARKMLQTPA